MLLTALDAEVTEEMMSSSPEPQVAGRRDAELRVIYDVGANNGDDIPYYLSKADLVVAIEADPSLAGGLERRFASAIAERRLIVENCVVTVHDGGVDVPFYLHQGLSVLNQFTGRPRRTATISRKSFYLQTIG